MTTWDELGFLSDEADRDARESAQRNPKWVAPALELNRLVHRLKQGFRPRSDNLQHMVSSLILTRALSTYEGTLLLAIRGMRPESEALLRTLLELMFMQAAIRHVPETAPDLVNADDHYRLKLFEGILRSIPREETPEVVESAEKGRAATKARVEEHGVRGISVQELARRAKLLGTYDTVYRVLCQPTHGQLRDLEEYVRRGQRPDPSVINWGPDHPAAKKTLGSAMAMLVDLVDNFAATIGAELGVEWEDLRLRLAALHSSAGTPDNGPRKTKQQ